MYSKLEPIALNTAHFDIKTDKTNVCQFSPSKKPFGSRSDYDRSRVNLVKLLMLLTH
jgi:hypothetical protein